MLIAHYGVALAAKKKCPNLSLGILFIAAQFTDLLCSLMLFLGLENIRYAPGHTKMIAIDFYHYPYSHGLIPNLLWALIFVLFVKFVMKKKFSVLWLGLLVFSHWILDFFVHKHDLTLYPGSTHAFGLGLWDSIVITLALEVGIFMLGFFIYLKSTFSQTGNQSLSLSLFVGFQLAMLGVVLFALPEPTSMLFAISGLGHFFIAVWALWIDTRRNVI